VKISEADGEGIDFGMNFAEQDADVFGVVPGERFGHGEFLSAESQVSRFQSFKVSKPQSTRSPRSLDLRNLETLKL
jgi:hypothetical protein